MRLFNWLKSVRNRVGRRGSRRRTGLGQRALSAWSSFGITSATVAPSVEPLEDRSMLTFMATLSATAVTITGDLAGDTLTFDVDDSGFLQHDRAGDAGFNSSIDLDSSTSGDQSLLASSVTSLTVNAGDGADTITLSAALTGLTGAVTINGDGGNDTVNLNADITFASGNSLNVDLTNDAAGGDVDQINVGANANLVLSGSGAATLKASRNIALASGSSVTTVNGNLIVEANQQGTPTVGNFIGINVNNGLIQASGTGAVTVQGKGGDGANNQYGVRIQSGGDIIGGTSGLLTVRGTGGATSGGSNLGVWVLNAGSTITSGGANVSVTGTGGGTGISTNNKGVQVQAAGQITAGGSGTVTVVGQGGNLTGTGGANFGVYVFNASSTITSSGGNVSVTGTGGGATTSTSNEGIRLEAAGQITAGGSGTVTVMGSGGNLTGTGGENHGVYIFNAGSTITSNGGNVSVTATGGGAGTSTDNMGLRIEATGLVTAGSGGTVTVLGQGGNLTGDGGNNWGVFVSGTNSTIASSGGNVSVTGTGGGAMTGSTNQGVILTGAGLISAGGSGTVTVVGQGGNLTGTGGSNHGVNVSNATIMSSGGNVSVTGIGGGAGSSDFNLGILVDTGLITAGGSGTVTVVGEGGNVSGSGALTNLGVLVFNTGSMITSSGGNVSVTGTEGGGTLSIAIGVESTGAITTATSGGTVTLIGNSMIFDGTSMISANNSNSVTLRQRTNGVAINLGATTNPIGGPLSLTDAELGQVTAGTLQIGDSNSGNVTISAEASPPNVTTFKVISGGAIRDTNTTATDLAATNVILDGNVSPGTSPGILNVTGNVTLASGNTLTVEIGGLTPGNTATNHDQLNATGSVTIGTNVTLATSSFGGFTPLVGQSFEIINRTGGTGTFTGLLEGATIPNFLGSGLSATITYAGGDGDDVVLVTSVNIIEDFGDAPDTTSGTGTGNYQTLNANGGPRHLIGTTQTTLFLGTSVDGETDATPTSNADGDDITTLPDDEDGVIDPAQDLVLTVNTAPVVQMLATNNTGSAAMLYGWIDYNQDGVFDNATERTSVAVPTATNNGTFTLTFPTIPFNTLTGATYARFRLSTDAAAGNSTGVVGDGEVEDYPATMTVLIDSTPPATLSFVRKTPTSSPTNADSLVFRVTFSEDVSGVAAGDFSVSGTTAGVSGVSMVSGSIYDVTVSGGDLANLNATVGLNFNTPTIADLAGNALPNIEPSTDEAYLVDNTSPATLSFVRKTPTSSPTNADSLVFRVTFSEDVSGVAAGDFSASGTTAGVSGVSMVSGSIYDVTVSGGNLANLNATVGLNFNMPTIADLAGNALPNIEPSTDETYLVNNTILVDYGDAPDTATGTGPGNYQTLMADNGPSHLITTTQTTLFLGTHVDDEADGTPTSNANGDDITTLPDDENGLIEPAQDLVLTVNTAPVVRMRATNNTGSLATLYGWIDFNQDGVFDNATERTSVAVPTATNNGTFTLTFPIIPLNSVPGETYARFRLSTDAAAGNSTGVVGDGEVEDYPATITLRSDSTVDSPKTKKIASGTNGGPALANSDNFGWSVVSVGDLNEDGVTDLAVGALQDDTGGVGRGAVYVQFMNLNGTVDSSVKIAHELNGGPTLADFDFFGSSLTSLGDFDGDGVNDLAVGARHGGAVYLLMLNATGTVKSSVKITGSSYFGSSVASLGDLDGDGVTDLAVGAQNDSTGGSARGAVHVVLLNADGTAKSDVKIAHQLNGGPMLADNDFFGCSAASLGDLDGDGVTDLAVGSWTKDANGTNRGAVFVLLLNANGTVKSSVGLASGLNGGPALVDHDNFGISVASIGDLDGDGVTDLAVGAFGDDTGGSARGAVHVLLLKTNGTIKSSLKVASGTNGGPTLTNLDNFGWSVASVGDLDGDGVTDLAVGASYDDTMGSNRGAVYVLFLKPLIVTDFGDAPDTSAGTGISNYQTLLANAGPRHVITASQNSLFLGAGVDGEANATPNSSASGDDITTLPDDEGGLFEAAQDLVLTVGSAPVVRVRATNTSGAAATLYGWIDFNRDGVFNNSTERTSISVPTATNNGTFMLTFPTIPTNTTAGKTYARFRLSTDIAAANSTGVAAGGEVEDYTATITLRSDSTVDSPKSKKIVDGTPNGPTLATYDSFGHSVAALGDLDGDGVTDLAVGAYGDDTGGGAYSNRGAVYVHFLNANGTVKSTVKVASGMNGGPTLLDDGRFGSAVAAVGDLDGDGVTDLAVGAHFDSTMGINRGAVYVLFMNSTGTVKSSMKIASGTNGGPMLSDADLFGCSVASLGDLDGDGVNDLAVGADGDDTGGSYRGAVHVLLMNVDGTVKSSLKLASGLNGGPTLGDGDRFGGAVASVGDVNGDGVTDLVVGARSDDTGGSARGAAHVLFLSANGTVNSSVKLASGTNGVPTFGGVYFGSAVSAAGDLDGDGVTDLAVGALGDNTNGVDRGAVHLLLLNSNGTVKSGVKLTSGTNGGPTLADSDRFGSSVTMVGDLDGDGLTDLAVGADGDDTGSASRGAVHILYLKRLTVKDFGDAPDTLAGTATGNYQTLSTDNGPSHLITTTQSTLFLGASVDGEVNATPTSNADGDDITTLPDDEGGLIEPAQDLVLTIGTVSTVRVRATNTTGVAATLYGWIDFNQDGVFSNGTERTSVLVPNGTNNGTFTLTFPTIPLNSVPGATYARFRLSSDVAAANSTGAATGGEVEDYTASMTYRTSTTVDTPKTMKIADVLNGGPMLANGNFFGSSVAAIGDLNNDGVTDLAIGAEGDVNLVNDARGGGVCSFHERERHGAEQREDRGPVERRSHTWVV